MARLRLLALFLAVSFWPGAAVAKPKPPQVKVNILVIEAHRKAGPFDARLDKLKSKIVRAGYKGAQVLDELNADEINIGSRVVLQMPSKKQNLRVRVLEVTKDQKIKLHVAIEGMKFETTTEHPNNGILLVGIPKKDKSVAMMLGVTPTIER